MYMKINMCNSKCFVTTIVKASYSTVLCGRSCLSKEHSRGWTRPSKYFYYRREDLFLFLSLCHLKRDRCCLTCAINTLTLTFPLQRIHSSTHTNPSSFYTIQSYPVLPYPALLCIDCSYPVIYYADQPRILPSFITPYYWLLQDFSSKIILKNSRATLAG